MNVRIPAISGLMLLYASLPAQALNLNQHHHHIYYHRPGGWPVHTAFGPYPYSYSNQAYRTSANNLAAANTNAVRQQMMMAYQKQLIMARELARNAQRRAVGHAHHRNAINAVSHRR